MCEIKAREQIEDDGVNYEDELKKSKKSKKKFRKGHKLVCNDYVNLQWESVCVEK